MNKITEYLKDTLSMSEHLDIEAASKSIHKNIHFRGPNVIILACAIIIASVGLNVNSIPVIIGAMLISPLMGPILGFGLGIGTNDTELVKGAVKNFVVMVGISLLASTLYFIITPLHLEHPTELLARTNPTLFDVFIALFGGTAGMLETCRKERGVVLSGVAIATALMPPLCTVGYGIANLNMEFILGAGYLFLINCAFISLATLGTAKFLNFPRTRYESSKQETKIVRITAAIATIIIVPSVFSGIQVIRESNFTRHATTLVNDHKSMGKSYIYDYKTNLSTKPATIELFMAGEMLTDEDKELIYNDAESYGITRNQIIFRDEATFENAPISDKEIIRGIYEQNEKRLQNREETIAELEKQLEIYKEKEIPTALIAKELSAQYDNIAGLILTRGQSARPDSDEVSEQYVAIVQTTGSFAKANIEKVENWLKVRLSAESVTVLTQLVKKSEIQKSAQPENQ